MIKCPYELKSKRAQKVLEEKVELLIQGVLKDKNEYQQEKAIDAFCQTFVYLENSLLYQHEIHPNMIDLVKVTVEPNRFLSATKKIDQMLENEINRSFRHFSIFLSV